MIEAKPGLDDLSAQYFKERLAQSRCYLEYGSGGSTVYACTVAKVPTVISVDSDERWVSSVRDSVGSLGSKLHVQHCDIGEVGEWGVPIDSTRMTKYWRYTVQPWAISRAECQTPDTVLIDGRFRVTAFLYCLIAGRVGTLILFDDYFDRPQYHIVERFCEVSDRVGRMAVFVLEKHFSYADITSCIMEYATKYE